MESTSDNLNIFLAAVRQHVYPPFQKYVECNCKALFALDKLLDVNIDFTTHYLLRS